MIQIKSAAEMARLRRTALAAQGLLQPQPFGLGLAGARKAIRHVGYVQIDSISVVERAHHHVLRSRVPDFTPSMTNQMLLDGDIFEYWAHAAAFLPMEDFRFSLPYKRAIKNGQTHWFKNPDKKLMAELLDRIEVDGPLRSRDLEANSKKGTGWWDWKPAKKALEQLYMQGDLMVCDRAGFQKKYDLTERVLPSKVNLEVPSTAELAAHLLDQQVRCHGLVSLKGVTYLRRNAELRKAVKALAEEKIALGLLEEVRLEGGEVFLIEAGALERKLPDLNEALLILSPFDNALIQRQRLKLLFDFDYQIECYLPAAKRQYGYFSLPLLYRGNFVGRLDCKTHRKIRELEIKSLNFESHNFDQDLVNTALVQALKSFCDFQNCDSVSLSSALPKNLSQSLQALF